MNPRILLIEDDLSLIELVRYNLEKEGFDVEHNTNAAWAVAERDVVGCSLLCHSPKIGTQDVSTKINPNNRRSQIDDRPPVGSIRYAASMSRA